MLARTAAALAAAFTLAVAASPAPSAPPTPEPHRLGVVRLPPSPDHAHRVGETRLPPPETAPPPPPAPAPTPTTAPPPPRDRSRAPWPESVERWRGLVAAYWSDVELALCLIAHESGGNPDATNPRSSASGLFQHLARYWPDRAVAAGWGGADVFDPEANVAVAAWLHASGGVGHWAVANLCT